MCERITRSAVSSSPAQDGLADLLAGPACAEVWLGRVL
jgi:hypothetical protein